MNTKTFLATTPRAAWLLPLLFMHPLVLSKRTSRLAAWAGICLSAAACRGQSPPIALTVPLQIVRVTDDDGSRQTHLSALEVLGWVNFANAVYAPANVQFTFDPLSDLTTVPSTLINNMTGTGDANWDAERRAANQVAASFPGKLVILARWGPGSGASGAGFSWWDYDFVVVPGYYDTFHCSYQNWTVLAHEVGHHLGLPHTFGGLFETVAAAAADFAARGNNPEVYDGDGFSDTPPHPSIVTQECPPHTNRFVLNGVTFTLPLDNIMSYYYEESTLTPQQTARARWMLAYYLKNGLHLPSNQGTPNPLEAEGLAVVQALNASYGAQSMSGFGRDGWSGNQQLFIGFANGGSLTLLLSVTNSGPFSIELYGTLAPDFGNVQCYIDGTPLGAVLDAYAPLVLPSGRFSLGTNTLSAGSHLLKLQCVGKSSLSSGYYFGFDCLRVTHLATRTAPAIQLAPLSQTAAAGARVVLSVVASGTSPISYQWRRNGVNIVGATGSAYEVPRASAYDGGTYSVIVSNAAGMTNAGGAILTVDQAPPISARMEAERIPVEQLQNITSYGPQAMSGFGTDWSGNAQLFLNYASGGSLSLLLWATETGWYTVDLAATRAPDFGTFQCYIDGNLAGEVIDAYASTVRPTGPVPLGIYHLQTGQHRLRIQSQGKNALSSNYRLGVDYVELTAFNRPTIAPLVGAGTTNVIVTWSTMPTRSYQVQLSTDLSSPNWYVLTDTIAAGPTMSITNLVPLGSTPRYYRVLAR